MVSYPCRKQSSLQGECRFQTGKTGTEKTKLSPVLGVAMGLHFWKEQKLFLFTESFLRDNEQEPIIGIIYMLPCTGMI